MSISKGGINSLRRRSLGDCKLIWNGGAYSCLPIPKYRCYDSATHCHVDLQTRISSSFRLNTYNSTLLVSRALFNAHILTCKYKPISFGVSFLWWLKPLFYWHLSFYVLYTWAKARRGRWIYRTSEKITAHICLYHYATWLALLTVVKNRMRYLVFSCLCIHDGLSVFLMTSRKGHETSHDRLWLRFQIA